MIIGTRFYSTVDWLALADRLERKSIDPDVSKDAQLKAAVSARWLRALKPLRDRVIARNVAAAKI